MTTDTDAFDLSPPTGGTGAPSFTFGDLSSPPDGFEQPLPTIISPPSFKEWPGSARDDAPLAKPAILNLDPGSPMDDGVARPPGDFPQGRLTDPLQHDGPTPYFAAPIDRQFHYYGALIDHADAYKAANGRDPEGADLAAIQDRAAAEAFPPGEEPVALRPYAAPASAVTSTSAPVGDGPAMSDTGEGGPVPQEQPASTPETEPPTSDTPEPAAPPPAEEPKPEPPKEEPPAAPEPGQQIAEAPSNQGDAGPPEGKKAEAAPGEHAARSEDGHADSTNSSFDKDKFADTLNRSAGPRSKGQCATFVREAFEAAKGDSTGHPKSAKDWGPTLEKNGFVAVDNDKYVPQKGDIAVIQPYNGAVRPDGHIAGYDGSQWVSDFKQPSLWPSHNYENANPSYKIYRHP